MKGPGTLSFSDTSEQCGTFEIRKPIVIFFGDAHYILLPVEM